MRVLYNIQNGNLALLNTNKKCRYDWCGCHKEYFDDTKYYTITYIYKSINHPQFGIEIRISTSHYLIFNTTHIKRVIK
jgi:hypothetical protein